MRRSGLGTCGTRSVTTQMITTLSCTVRLCSRFARSASGVVSRLALRKTPVRGARYAGGSIAWTSSTNARSGPSSSVRLRVTISRPRCHVVSTTNTMSAISEREPPAVEHLREVRAEEREVDGQERRGARDHEPQRLVPQLAHDDEEEHRVDRQRARHRDPVGRREVLGRAEADHERDDRDVDAPVDGRDVDLPDLLARRVEDREARQEPELHRLARHRERPGDDRLRRDHGREGREHDHRQPRPVAGTGGRTGCRRRSGLRRISAPWPM